MNHTLLIASALLAALPLGTQAADWTGTGELGIAAARGNARSENLNGKLAFQTEDDQWKHNYSLSALRAKGEVVGDFDGDGTPEERFELNANRYEFAASSALKVNEVSSWIAALRYEKNGWGAALNVTNLFDKEYVKGCQTTMVCGYGDGRTFTLKLSKTW